MFTNSHANTDSLTYALGIGVLFWLIAVFAVSLPKSGSWMEWIKSFGGVALLAVAVYFLRPIIPAITELGVGEALVSTLQDKGIPTPVQRTLVRPPSSRMGAATAAERQAVIAADINQKRYAEPMDPRSAHEVLAERTAARLKQQEQAELEKRAAKTGTQRRSSRSRQSAGEAFIKSMARSLGSAAGSSVGRKLFRGILGSLLK